MGGPGTLVTTRLNGLAASRRRMASPRTASPPVHSTHLGEDLDAHARRAIPSAQPRRPPVRDDGGRRARRWTRTIQPETRFPSAPCCSDVRVLTGTKTRNVRPVTPSFRPQQKGADGARDDGEHDVVEAAPETVSHLAQRGDVHRQPIELTVWSGGSIERRRRGHAHENYGFGYGAQSVPRCQ